MAPVAAEQVSAAKTAPPKLTVVKDSDSSEQDAVQNKEGAKDRPADVTTTDEENNTTSTADDISAARPEESATPTGTTTNDDTKTSEFHRRRGQEVRRQRREGRRCRRQETTGQRQEAIGHDKKYKKADSGADKKYTVKHKKSAVLTSCSIPRPRTRWCVIVYACATRYGHYSSLS
jgi:hypothetical protein